MPMAQDILVVQCHQALPQQHCRRTSFHPPTALPSCGPCQSRPTPTCPHPRLASVIPTALLGHPTDMFDRASCHQAWTGCDPQPRADVLVWPWPAHIPTYVPNVLGWGMSCSMAQFRTGRAQDRIQTSFEFLQVWTFHTLSQQHVPVFDHPRAEKAFYCFSGIYAFFSVCPNRLLFCQWASVTKTCLQLF